MAERTICLSESGVREILSRFEATINDVFPKSKIEKIEWTGKDIPHSAFSLDIAFGFWKYRIDYNMPRLQMDVDDGTEAINKTIDIMAHEVKVDLIKAILNKHERFANRLCFDELRET